MQLRIKLVAILAMLICAHEKTCSAFSQTEILSDGDAPLVAAPVADLYRELDRVLIRLNIRKPPHPYVESTSDSPDVENSDLRSALSGRGLEGAADDEIATEFARQRAMLTRYQHERTRWLAELENNDDSGPAPQRPALEIPAGMPGEFADYFRGAIAWHQGQTNAARAAWSQLLERPAKDRKFKSVWAAYMLARSWEAEDANKAITWFGLSRAMAQEGFAGSLGLAIASLGWQARIHLRRGEFERAIDLYLQQLAAGDYSGYASLRTTVERAIRADAPALQRLATNRVARCTLTAVLTTDGFRLDQAASRWLAAMENVGAIEAELAEQLAVISYQLQHSAGTRRWIKRAPKSPACRWLDAKMLVSEGKVSEATRLLARLAPAFPLFESTNTPAWTFSESLRITDHQHLSAGQHILGELGVLRLHRGEFASALDCLARAGFWSDSVYVAERVLMVDELKDYVDAHWPEIAAASADDEEAPESIRPSKISRDLRYLLARRLVRNGRRLDADAYFPPEWQEAWRKLNNALITAEDSAQLTDLRAANYMTAAWIVRTNGIELMGTEGAPDFAMWGGDFENGLTVHDREQHAESAVSGACSVELARAHQHHVEPQDRWHYRAHAAALAYEAAKLLPDHDDRTARALYCAGKWVRDLGASDLFYKMLVRRCSRTELGRAANERHWFPPLDGTAAPFRVQGLKPR